MFAWLIGIIVPKLADDAVAAIFWLISGEMQKRSLIAQGQAYQAAAETASAEATQANIAQAEANAPQTKTAALQRLRDGTA